MFEEDIYQAISMKTCVEKRITQGAPGRKAMEEALKAFREEMDRA